MYYPNILPRPTAEMIGDMLLQMNKPADALLAYQAALKLATKLPGSRDGSKEGCEALRRRFQCFEGEATGP